MSGDALEWARGPLSTLKWSWPSSTPWRPIGIGQSKMDQLLGAYTTTCRKEPLLLFISATTRCPLYRCTIYFLYLPLVSFAEIERQFSFVSMDVSKMWYRFHFCCHPCISSLFFFFFFLDRVCGGPINGRSSSSTGLLGYWVSFHFSSVGFPGLDTGFEIGADLAIPLRTTSFHTSCLEVSFIGICTLWSCPFHRHFGSSYRAWACCR